MKPRLILFGTPEFAERTFRPLLQSGAYEIAAIVTQPDKPVGRGLEVGTSPVKGLAQEYNIPVLQPVFLKGIALHAGKLEATEARTEALVARLNELAPVDLFIVVAYGRIIPEALLGFPRLGALNIHGSLLPRWRGAAPIHRALASGDAETGVCIMQLEAGLDTGPVFSSRSTAIAAEDDFGTVHDRLALLGSELLAADLPKILSGELRSTPQRQVGVTHADKWTAGDLLIDWQAPADDILNKIRASSPAPGARSTLGGELIKIFRAALREGAAETGATHAVPGTVIELSASEIAVQLQGSSQLLIRELQLAGRKRLPAAEIIRGRGIKQGDRFGA